MNRQAEDGPLKYNFTDEGLVKQLDVTDLQQKQLAKGLLAIVKTDGDYAIVPGVVADKVALRDESIIISHAEVEEVDEDDPYKDYVIPDDLMW
jgi:hypothetical protein